MCKQISHRNSHSQQICAPRVTIRPILVERRPSEGYLSSFARLHHRCGQRFIVLEASPRRDFLEDFGNFPRTPRTTPLQCTSTIALNLSRAQASLMGQGIVSDREFARRRTTLIFINIGCYLLQQIASQMLSVVVKYNAHELNDTYAVAQPDMKHDVVERVLKCVFTWSPSSSEWYLSLMALWRLNIDLITIRPDSPSHNNIGLYNLGAIRSIEMFEDFLPSGICTSRSSSINSISSELTIKSPSASSLKGTLSFETDLSSLMQGSSVLSTL